VQQAIDKARVLIEALPYIRQFRQTTFVVKIGGAALEDEVLRRRFAENVVLLRWVGIRVVVVHGGGKQISGMLDRLGLEPKFVDGQRVTDEEALSVVEMVLGGKLNQELVRLVQQCGGRAVGLTGKDGGLALARRRQGPPDLGLVGDIVEMRPDVIEHLDVDFTPVIAPLAVTESGQTLNINADPFAAELAVALGAEKLVLLSDVEGVKDLDGELIPSLSEDYAEQLLKAGVIKGGMIPKVNNALGAVRRGVGKVHIIDARTEHALLLEIFTSSGIGTEVVRGEKTP
jgi:acetylglutamate kinase